MKTTDLSARIKLKVVYEDPEVVVMTAPNEEELKDILMNLLRTKPMTIKELHAILSGIASEDKIRRALFKLADEGKVLLQPDGRFIPAGI